jgi:hypothetical protein
MYPLEIKLKAIESENGTMTILLTCQDELILTMTYSDPELAQYIVSNLNDIISDLLDDAIENMISYDLDQELKQLLEEEGNK